MENEPKTVAMVKDIADLLESIAADGLHTPALYSTFLRALISAKTDPPKAASPDFPPIVNGDAPSVSATDQTSGFEADPSLGLKIFETSADPTFSPAIDFQLTSEMGPVADMSTFPPTMAAPQAIGDESHGLGMSMDNILSTGFWDSMLVPGKWWLCLQVGFYS